VNNLKLLTGVSRRELLGSVARWSVPTVLSLTLGARALEAAPSCPPCTRRSGGKCKACSVSQILNCQCEPCLGAPYCSSPAAAAPAFGQSSPLPGVSAPGQASPSGQNGQNGPPGFGGLGSGGYDNGGGYNRSPATGLRGPTSANPLGSSTFGTPFQTDSRYRPIGGNPFDNGLYGRLRGDTINQGRRP